MIAKMLSQKQIRLFQKDILEWYKKNKRDLPWRHSRDPYTILVSEIMLQQTQVRRVIPKFTEWMRLFPSVESLTKVSVGDILRVWSGLGYNRRALYLKRLAQEIVKNHNGMFPQTKKELIELPGIGEYTASALLCFAYDQQVAVVDTNVRKVILTKLHSLKSKNKALKASEIQLIADQLLPKGKAYEWNQALMDYSSAMLRKEKIPIPKQSPFKTSKRFYRGQIIRLLLNRPETESSLFDKIENNGITRVEFTDILEKLKKDNLVKKEKGFFLLS